MNTEPHDLDAELERHAWAAYAAATDGPWEAYSAAVLDAWETSTSDDEFEARIAAPGAAFNAAHDAAWAVYLEQIAGTRFAARHQPLRAAS